MGQHTALIDGEDSGEEGTHAGNWDDVVALCHEPRERKLRRLAALLRRDPLKLLRNEIRQQLPVRGTPAGGRTLTITKFFSKFSPDRRGQTERRSPSLLKSSTDLYRLRGGQRQSARRTGECSGREENAPSQEPASERRVRKDLDAELFAGVDDAVALHDELPRRVLDFDKVDLGFLCGPAERLGGAL